jgi:hypothetical protein
VIQEIAERVYQEVDVHFGLPAGSAKGIYIDGSSKRWRTDIEQLSRVASRVRANKPWTVASVVAALSGSEATRTSVAAVADQGNEQAIRDRDGRRPAFRSWQEVEHARDLLKKSSVLATRFIASLDSSRKKHPLHVWLCEDVGMSGPLKGPCVDWASIVGKRQSLIVSATEASSDPSREVDVVAKRLAAAIQADAKERDLPFVILLEMTHEVGWASGAMSEANRLVLGRHVQTPTDDVLGFLLTALEKVEAPGTRNLIAESLATPNDPRVLPGLVDWFYFHPQFYASGKPLLMAIKRIDPKQEILRLYYEYYEGYARGGYVPAQTRSARMLREELVRLER